MERVNDWKHGESVTFFARHVAPPFLPPALSGDIRLFNVVCHKDGSIYTNYLGATGEVESKGALDGILTHHKKHPVAGSEYRISIHGSGEVLDFNRGRGQMISHLGFSLRKIQEPKHLVTHRIGGMANYLADLLKVQKSKKTAVLVGEIFDQPLQPVFRIFVGPESYTPQGESFVFHAITQPLCNGRRFSIAIALQYEPWTHETLRDHEIQVNAKPLTRFKLFLRWLRIRSRKLINLMRLWFCRGNC